MAITPVPLNTPIGTVLPNENLQPPADTSGPLVGSSRPVQAISKAAFDIRKPRLLEITEKAIIEKRELTYDEVKDYIALPVKVDVEPIIEEPVEKP